MINTNEIKAQLIKAREEYIHLIKSELLGPGSEFSIPNAKHELISTSPICRYSIGILYPQGNTIDLATTITDKNTELETDFLPHEESEAPTKENLDETPSEEDLDETPSEEDLDEEIALSAQYMPSSMGITFIVKGNADNVCGSVSFATYRKAKVEDCIIPFVPSGDHEHYSVSSNFKEEMVYDKELGVLRLISVRNIYESDTTTESDNQDLSKFARHLKKFFKDGYVREPHTANFSLNFSSGDYIDKNKKLDGTNAKIIARRTKINDDFWSLTVILVNEIKEAPVKPDHCIFQSKITISSELNSFIFQESYPNSTTAKSMDDEERSLELLYREKKIYGTGLGTAAEWAIDAKGKGSIWNEFFPQAEIPPMSFDLPENDVVSVNQLSMKFLSDLDSTDKQQKLLTLRGLVNLYKNWVDELEKTAEQIDPKYQSAASKNIAECKKTYKRMYAGINTLDSNAVAYNAFTLANRAMFMQRVHLRMQSATANINRYPGDEELSTLLKDMNYFKEDDKDCRWRPFQIAFLLMDINSIVNDSSEERNTVDLIWFPTGGGKTEAYLGLTAFTIFYRKLAHLTESSGTTVIMRYTLRLLAAQQFTRAATLICACENIRKDCENCHTYPTYSLGKEMITIGLWIGGSHTPNKNEDAKKCLKELKAISGRYNAQNVKDKYNKFQLLKCPWCGTKLVKDNEDKKLIGKWGYNLRDEKYFYMFCPHESCNFREKLPIQIVDEELYKEPPTLLFGTVDKFAMMAWDGHVGSFFASRSRNRPPELIIQDELHLISGALGTMVGLYETAVDALCQKEDVFPKIIASTATIRRAKEQCSVLYNRDVVQFPAPGLNSEDSFFAREAKVSYENAVFGRKYVGIMPSGKTKVTMEIRAMATLLQNTYTMNLQDEIKDKLWTLTVYFNSLKDLGQTSSLIRDEIKNLINQIAYRLCKKGRWIGESDELTSRVTTTKLNETLDKLEKREYSSKTNSPGKYASNVLLATNMISVGIDIARLNVMLMIGQPKLTSEYIQASSRIGRSFPGVAFIQYDMTKSRDRSHYERFKTYHESFYRFVEPTGATPFSKPARERALHAIITAIIRQKEGLIEDKSAIEFNKETFKKTIADLESFILNRIKSINDRSGNRMKDDIEEVQSEIESFISQWQGKVNECKDKGDSVSLYFGRRFMIKTPKEGEMRLLKQYNSPGQDNALKTLTSMRNVDTQVTGEVLIGRE